MQTKPDVEQMLMQSLKELVLVIPLEKITIKEITDKAQVIRPTFYNHFQDKYEVVERIIKDEILQPIRPLLQNDMIDESMILIFSNLQKEKEFYTKLAKTTGQNSFEEIVRKCVEELLLEFMISKTGWEGQVADAGNDRQILCAVYDICCHELDPERNASVSKGDRRGL